MKRNVKKTFLMIFDSIIIFMAHFISYFFLYPLIQISQMTFFIHILFVVVVYIVLGLMSKVFDKINRFTGIQETITHVFVVMFSFILATVAYNLYRPGISFRYVTFAFLISVVLIPLSRVVWRFYREYIYYIERNADGSYVTPIRTLLIGAGEGGATYVRYLRSRSDVSIVGFLDDNVNKVGTTLYGHPVIAKIDELESVVEKYHIDQITIAIPSLSKTQKKKILDMAKKTKVRTNQMPYIEDVLSGKYQLSEFKDIEVTDLLGRDEVDLDTHGIKKQLNGQTVLVSGAGGSIGSEICRQLLNFSPKRIILLDQSEYFIYKVERELNQLSNYSIEIIPVIADIQNRDRIFEVMKSYNPDIVYHAAAYKHVPLMEKNPREAIRNNIFGTKNIAEASKAADIKSFVMVSTDKAVNPPNIMGATKRVAEMIVTGLNEPEKTNFTAVRFGNVLNSSGSVIPVFKEQIEKGGPVTVTDFRMTRYFMTIPEASRLVLQAGSLANGGEIFVLDMGEPVKILELAKQMIWLSGNTEEEIGIKESGIRPGEKLYEELLASDENVNEKVFDKIFVGKVNNIPLDKVYRFIDRLDALSNGELTETLLAFANNSYNENIQLIEQLESTTNQENMQYQ